MLSRSIVPAPKSALSLKQALELSNFYLESAYRTTDHDIALVLCHDAEVALSQAKSANKKVATHPGDVEYQMLRDGVAAAYIDLGKLLESQGCQDVAQAICKKAEKWGGNSHDPGRLAQTIGSGNGVEPLKDVSDLVGGSRGKGSAQPSSLDQHKQSQAIAVIPAHIFAENVRPLTVEFKFPEADERLSSTPQLAYCLNLLQLSLSTSGTLEPDAQKWIRTTEKDIDEQERLYTMATEVIRVFKRDEIKDAKSVAEVVFLAPALNKDAFHDLLRDFYSGIDHSGLLSFHQLEGLAQLVRGANPGHLSSDDLVKILDLLSTRLRDTHQQSTQHVHQLTLAVSHVLDAMADTKVTDLDRETLHEPLTIYLGELKNSPDPYLVYQAAYAYQALLCVPDNETTWQAAMRRTGKVIQGVSGLVGAIKGFDLNMFIDGLSDIQQGLAGASTVVGLVQTAYDGATLAEGGKGFFDCLKEGLSFERKRDWYSALRGADVMIQAGELATFRKLACEVPCRLDPAFQWGVCQRLGEIAIDSLWHSDTRQNAVEFLGEIYQDDVVWGQRASIKQWILNILAQLASAGLKSAELLLQELETSGDDKKKALCRSFKENDPISYPLKATLPELASPSLLDRVQNRPDVESNLRLLRRQRIKERSTIVYVPPQAKASLQSADDSRFPLMEKVKESIESDRKVFLLLGDSGAGKSTFSRELEFEMWQMYKAKTGRIPLHINLPAIDKPEHDMIAKQLRRNEFTEPQIREMKHHRKFILICDGYDESQQTHNLYTSNRLNLPGEWDAQMIISCRSEYLGSDYRDRFQPGDRNQQSDSPMYQEAVMTPFSLDQVQDYIHQYVSIHQPLWQEEDYRQALELIPSLKDLVRNPFLMTLSLDVLPRMVDPGQHLSTAHVTRVGLYDHFVEQWIERGKKRLGEKDMTPQARAAFERLSDEGFTPNGIEYLKTLAVAIYKEQGGQPIVEYSSLIDKKSWKTEFFSQEDNQLLREACPLTRNGNQHRFIHQSLLEYALALAVFDPQDRMNRAGSEVALDRRRSMDSTMSFEFQNTLKDESDASEQEPDVESPLVWRSFVNEHSLLQFLEERVQQEPLFKQQLFEYLEHSKNDKKWRTAAANAITILVRAGEQFIETDLKGIQIPGADLSYGVFDSVQLQDADLRKVNLRGIWLRQTDLSRSRLTGARFGEIPSLTEDDGVLSCTYSPDGKSFVVGLQNGSISVYTTPNWEKVRTLSGHYEGVWRVVYSPDGNQFASAGQDGTMRLWNVETWECEHVLVGHNGWVIGAAYSPQGDQVASSSGDMTIRLWNVVTGKCLRTLRGHDGAVICVAYSPKGNQAVSCSGDSTIRFWDIETGICSRVLSGHTDRVWCIAFSPQGDQIASASGDTTVRLWDVKEGICQHVLKGHSNAVYRIVYSPKGDQVVSGGYDGSLRVWDPESGTWLTTLVGHSNSVSGVIFSPRGNQLASCSYDKTVRLWSISEKASRPISFGHTKEVCGVKCSPNGDLVVSGSTDGMIRFWDLNTGAHRQTLSSHGDSILSVAFSPEGDCIASGSADNLVRLWEVETGMCLQTLTGHDDMVNNVAYSSQGHQIASASDDNTARIWNVATGECEHVLEGHSEWVLGVAFSPNGDQIATSSKDNTIRIWDAKTGECCQILEGHTGWARDVVYSSQGQQLASAGYDNTVRTWDVETAECRSILIGHSDRVACVAYSSQGHLLASGSWDKTVRLWHVAGQSRAVIRNFVDSIACVTWGTSSGADHLIAGCGDGSVLMWQIIEEGDLYRVHLVWNAASSKLCMSGAIIQDVRGLSHLNTQLLKQRGAIGEPENLLREASKKLMTMASVVSKLKTSNGTEMEVPSAIDPPAEQVEQQDEPRNGP